MLRSRVNRLISFEQKNLNLTGVDGRPSVVRHGHFLNLRSLTSLFMQLCLSCLNGYVRMHDQIGHKLPMIEIVWTATFIISILLKRMSLNPVSETIYNAQGPR